MESKRRAAIMKDSKLVRSVYSPWSKGVFLLLSLLSLVFVSCVTGDGEAGSGSVVFINEIMAKNSKSLSDDQDKSPDWIELFVGKDKGITTVNLAGWSLTDDPEHLDLWPFPSHDILVNDDGLVVVFASGVDSEMGEEEGNTDGQKQQHLISQYRPLHTSFKLSDKGDYLALLDGEGNVVDEVKEYPVQYKDISWGRAGRGSSASSPFGYLAAPTPGRPNTASLVEGTPILKQVTKTSSPPPTIHEDLEVSACVSVATQQEQNKDALLDKLEVTLHYKVNYESREYSMTMKEKKENSTYCKSEEGFSHFSATLEKRGFSGPAGTHPGDMLRWYVKASLGSAAARAPSLEVRDLSEVSDDRPKYFGTVIVSNEDAADQSASAIDKLYWFIPEKDMWDIERKQGHEVRCNFYFQGHFYDNVRMRQRGITALLWPKKKFKVDFKGSDFKIKLSDGKSMNVEEFNLQSHWEEPGEETFMRENIASEFFKEAGLPVFETLHVELVQNGRFYGLYSIIEQIDDNFLDRMGYNPNGHLYKAFSGTASNLNDRVPERLMKKVYRRGNKVEDENDWSDLHALTKALAGKDKKYSSVEEYLFNHMNLPQLINELALQAAILNQDRCTKNYYVYYDVDSEEWSRFPWDLEAVMGISSALGGIPAPDYCMLVCPQFNSPLYCDSDHPQDPLPSYGKGTANYVRKANVVPGLETPELNYNHLTDALLDTPSIREMYLRRLKTIVDQYVSTDYLQKQVVHHYNKIKSVAKKDDSKWDTGDIDEGYQQLIKEQLPQRKEQLLSTYAAGGPEALLPLSQNLSNVKLEIKDAYIPLNGEFTLSIEIHNPEDAAIDMSGWILTNSMNVSDARTYLPSKPYCNDVEPKNTDYTCKDLVSWGSCGLKSVQKKGLCRKSCGNCRMKEGPMRFTFLPGTVIPSNSSIFITDNLVDYRKSLRRYKMFEFVVGPLDGELSTSSSLKIFNPQDKLVVEKPF